MSIRLVGNLRDQAREELLTILRDHPKGVTTGALQGTRRFHGERTLSLYQIRTILRETGRVKERAWGAGKRTSTLWQLREGGGR
jgi:hypothetical protein